jgi:mannose-1-phosphate guanylyltransferase
MTRRSEAIRDAFGDGAALGLALDYAYEETPLGSGGAIGSIASTWRTAEGAPWDRPFLVVNGDVITDLDITAMVANHHAKGAALSLSLHEVEDPSPYGVVEIDAEGRIHRFVEKPAVEDAPSCLINAGTWVFDPRLIAMLDPSTFHRVEDRLFPALCDQGAPVYGFHQDAYWRDIGNPEALLQVNLDMAAGLVTSPAASPSGRCVYVDQTSIVDDDATLEAPVVIGAGCHINAGATVTRSLLWEGVTVSAGACISDSIIATGVTVGDRARVTHSVVAHHATIQPDASLQGERVDPVGHPAATQSPAGTGTP